MNNIYDTIANLSNIVKNEYNGKNNDFIGPMEKILTLNVKRVFTNSKYTIGKLYINGEYFCDTLEDVDRDLHNKMTEAQVQKIKVYSQTAIPFGEYDITMNVISPKFKNHSWAKKYGGYVPRILNVPGFLGILIHPLNRPEETAGCIGVGKNTAKGQITSSVYWFSKLMDEYLIPAKESGKKIKIVIEQCYS